MISAPVSEEKKSAMRHVKKVLLFFSIILLIFVVREFLELYVLLESVHPVMGYAYILAVFILLAYFVIFPIWRIFRIPAGFKPVKSVRRIDKEIAKRLTVLKVNPYLRRINFDFSSVQNDHQSYERIVGILSKECANIRKKYVKLLFISTAASPNGFLDAILILSANVSIVKEIFVLYNNRMTCRDLWPISRQIFNSVLIGGSEIVENGLSYFVTKIGKDLGSDIPFVGKLAGSVSDGFLSAVLLTRTSLLTENYCKTVYVKSYKDLYPRPTFILSTGRDLFLETIKETSSFLLKMFRKKKAAEPDLGEIKEIDDEDIEKVFREAISSDEAELDLGTSDYSKTFKKIASVVIDAKGSILRKVFKLSVK